VLYAEHNLIYKGTVSENITQYYTVVVNIWWITKFNACVLFVAYVHDVLHVWYEHFRNC